MAAKRKVPAKKSAARPRQPRAIRLKEFLQIFHDTEEYASDRSFCFILGSGASLTAGIPTGASLVNRWLVEMHDADDACSKRILPPHATIETYADSLLDGEKERLKKWSEAKFSMIPGFTFENRAAYYGRIYKARFQSDPVLGQRFLRKLIHRRPPSIGFHLLARILNRTRHRIVITTNFDHLVEDAIAITENEAVQSYNHEGLAGFLRGSSDLPAIAKIHGDILLRTFNAEDELETLNEHWTSALGILFQTHTPIIIGYGGNDPGFMDFLIEEMKDWPADRRCYWFVRKTENFGKIRKSGELSEIQALRLVECPGFTELMVMLDEIFNFKALDEELREKAELIATSLTSASAKARGEVAEHNRKLRESSFLSDASGFSGGIGSANAGIVPPPASRTWQDWREVINSCTSRKDQEETVQEALESMPDSLPLKAVAAALALRNLPSDPSRVQEIEKLLKESESRYGPDHEETLAIMHSLAFAWHLLAEFTKAETIYRRVVAERTRVLGPEHPSTLSSRYNLASVLDLQGKSSEAEKEHRALLAINERLLGQEHPKTLASRNSLANALNSQDKHAEAEKEHRAVLAIKERVLGPEYSGTLMSRINLADALNSQGKYLEAEVEYRAVLAIQERVLGPEHFDVFLSCYNLSLCLEGQGKKLEALEFARQTLAGWTKILGAEHPDTLDAKRQVEDLERK